MALEPSREGLLRPGLVPTGVEPGIEVLEQGGAHHVVAVIKDESVIDVPEDEVRLPPPFAPVTFGPLGQRGQHLACLVPAHRALHQPGQYCLALAVLAHLSAGLVT